MKNKYNWKALGLMILSIIIGMLIVFIWHVDQVKFGEMTLLVLDDGNLILKIWKGFVALSWIIAGVAFIVFLFKEFPVKPGRKDILGHLGHIESIHTRKSLNAPIKNIDNNSQEDLNKTVPNVPEPKTEHQNYEGVTVKVGDTFVVIDQTEHPCKSYRLAITKIDAKMKVLDLDKSAETSGKFVFCIRNENQSV